MSLADQRIYLASRSPRRRELLKQIGVQFQSLLLREDGQRGPDVDETPYTGEPPTDYALRIARTKAEVALLQLARRGLPPHPVLAADTTVALGERVIGKPRDQEDAEHMLRELSGREHAVITAIAVGLREAIETQVCLSRVWFRDLTEAEIRRYVATGEPLDKAGSYAIQGRAAAFVVRIEGSYSGIMGLPLAETAALLEKFGVPVL